LSYLFLFSGRELRTDTPLAADDIISSDRTIKNEITRMAANERILLKDRLIDAVVNGGLCISPDIWSDKYRKISYLGATAHFVDKDHRFHSIDLFCTEFTAKVKTGENIMEVRKNNESPLVNQPFSLVVAIA
jgi:hypothetical protein